MKSPFIIIKSPYFSPLSIIKPWNYPLKIPVSAMELHQNFVHRFRSHSPRLWRMRRCCCSEVRNGKWWEYDENIWYITDIIIIWYFMDNNGNILVIYYWYVYIYYVYVYGSIWPYIYNVYVYGSIWPYIYKGIYHHMSWYVFDIWFSYVMNIWELCIYYVYIIWPYMTIFNIIYKSTMS